jgi:hypothetical protein
MTEDELKTLVRAGDCDAVAAALKNLSESERGKLAAVAVCLRENPKSEQVVLSSELAVLGLCAPHDVRRLFCWSYDPRHYSFQVAMKVLDDRRPSWINAFVDETLRVHPGGWTFIRELIRRRLCVKPKNERYIDVMAYGLSHHSGPEDEYRPLSQRLKADPELLEDEIWRLFETENQAFTKEYSHYDHNPKSETWTVALKKLSDAGVIDRQRLLDCSLTALQSDFKRQLLTGYIQFHETMEPTAEEMQARQGR